MIRILLVASLACTSGIVGAAERISAFDFLIDGKSYRGNQVAIHGCTVIGASASILMCNVKSRGNSVGNIIIDGDSMDRASLRRSMTECSSMEPKRSCEIREMTGHVRVNGMGDLRLDQAIISWR